MNHRRPILAALLAALFAGPWVSGPVVPVAGAELPARLSDADFWRIVDTFSEPDGFFRSDNLVSNEETFQFVIPTLASTVVPGGVYVGVGPDQNFTYIAAVRPRLAFIMDIRRGNLHLHLMYKALFEQSADRAEFLSRLFSRARPDGLSRQSTPEALFEAFELVRPDRERFDRNVADLTAWLTRKRAFPLSGADLSGVIDVYSRFYAAGPYLRYSNSSMRGRRYPSYQDLQLTDDGRAVNRSYMASDAHFRFVKGLQERNLVIPIVGDFAGPKALRTVGAYLQQRGGIVTTYYTSNVEQYLFPDGAWPTFVENLSALPLDDTSTLIRSCFNNCSSTYRSWSLLDSIPALIADARAGRLRMYWDVLSRSR